MCDNEGEGCENASSELLTVDAGASGVEVSCADGEIMDGTGAGEGSSADEGFEDKTGGAEATSSASNCTSEGAWEMEDEDVGVDVISRISVAAKCASEGVRDGEMEDEGTGAGSNSGWSSVVERVGAC